MVSFLKSASDHSSPISFPRFTPEKISSKIATLYFNLFPVKSCKEFIRSLHSSSSKNSILVFGGLTLLAGLLTSSCQYTAL